MLAHHIYLCLAMIVYCGTREQMMLQDLVRHRAEAWAILGFSTEFIIYEI